MIRQCTEEDFQEIYNIINDSAQAYRGVIPEDRWHDPYMSREKLSLEIQDGIAFWGDEQNGQITGIMGIQDKGEVTLIRHAYVRTSMRSRGVGTRLMQHLEPLTENPILIGTWADAVWAISFYQKNGYKLVNREEKNRLLKKFWNIPDRQVETSVVLADRKWISRHPDAVRSE
ncbi:MAG: GNAT family N-acetyltransferase [Pseudomonadota bacterium]